MKKKKPALVMVFIFIVIVLVLIVRFYNTQVITFTPIAGPLVNPLMGWAPWATIKESLQPHTLVYADLTWRDFEPAEGSFDFAAFEGRNQLERWRSEGKRVVFRFVADIPGDSRHLDIPDWLYEKMDGAGDFYDNEYGQGFSPDYAHPAFLAYHQKAISALGERYGQDDFFAYIELGSIGHWGEWHVYYGDEIRRLPGESVRDQYVAHYRQAFPNTHLLMRRPFNIAYREKLGVYNDMAADAPATEEWLEWIAFGGEYSQTGEKAALSAMPDGWQSAPIGGEQTQSMSDDEIYASELDKTISLFRESHTTFIGPGCPYEYPLGGNLQEGFDQVLSNIGYRLYVQKVRLPKFIFFGKSIPIKVSFSNDGVAPFYYNWQVMAYILDMDNKIVRSQPVPMDIRKVFPGETYKINFTFPIDNLENASYSIGLAIIDPISNLPAVKLAMPHYSPKLFYELGTFSINKLFN